MLDQFAVGPSFVRRLRNRLVDSSDLQVKFCLSDLRLKINVCTLRKNTEYTGLAHVSSGLNNFLHPIDTNLLGMFQEPAPDSAE